MLLILICVTALSPSAASTQVVPNGGKGGTAAEGETEITRITSGWSDAGGVCVKTI